jgi:hypothetical protein
MLRSRRHIKVTGLLTVMSMHLLWNQEPQHPKNATTKMMTPTAIQRLSALIMLYLGRSWV